MSTREEALRMRLGRSLKLRDLHTLTVVAELGSRNAMSRMPRIFKTERLSSMSVNDECESTYRSVENSEPCLQRAAHRNRISAWLTVLTEKPPAGMPEASEVN
jgi:hypothetical protein